MGVSNRRCVKETTINGIHFPEGLVVEVDPFSLHYDPELWGPVSVNEFYPLRFANDQKRNPLAFISFGGGPRICVGRFFYCMLYLQNFI